MEGYFIDETETLNLIEQTSSTNEKLRILKEGMTPKMIAFLQLSLDENSILNIAKRSIENALKVTTNKKFADIGLMVEWYLNQPERLEEPAKTFEDFIILYEQLQNARGLDAINLLHEFFLRCMADEAKWYARCLTKNLHCGLLIKSVNKVFKELKLKPIPTFQVNLCEKINCDTPEDMKKDLDELIIKHGVLYCEPKYDGVRIILRSQDGEIEAFSRNGKPIQNADFLKEEFKRLFTKEDGTLQDMTLDGEIIAEDFQTLMTQVNRKHKQSESMKRQFMVFDILMLDGNVVESSSYLARRILLETHISKDSNIIKVVAALKATDTDTIMDFYDKCAEAGMEGIVIKNNNGYHRGRDNWYKMKPIDTADLLIYDVEQGTGKNANRNAVLCVKDKSGSVISKVGSGLTETDIEYINANNVVGQIAEIRYDCITKSDEHGMRSLRFPRFVKFREDKEEADEL